MLISKEVEIAIGTRNTKYLSDLGYILSKSKDINGVIGVPRGTKLFVKVEDLLPTCKTNVKVLCDNSDCGIELDVSWQSYNKYVHKDGKYYCQKCAKILYGGENIRKARLKNGKSFEKWCIDNNRQDVLNRWDCDLNDKTPSEISYSTNKKFYFKCPMGVHKSELKNINHFTGGQEGSILCNQCDSFAQWGIDNLGDDFLEKYWDYEKNIISPWEVSYGSNKPKVFIKCQEKDYHESYFIACNGFINNVRCPYCCNYHGKVHPLDSLGQYTIDNYGEDFLNSIWSEKNTKSPFELSPNNGQEVWWKCSDEKHDDYFRITNSSNLCNFRCPECQFSKGEKRIEEWLLNNEFIKISNEYTNCYISQKEFNDLVGIGNRNLSYDFYLPQHNLLIEYQGEQHDHPVDFKNEGKKKAEENFKKQKEHDRRKKEYADNNNIKLLPIWYWDYDNIEEVLNKELK